MRCFSIIGNYVVIYDGSGIGNNMRIHDRDFIGKLSVGTAQRASRSFPWDNYTYSFSKVIEEILQEKVIDLRQDIFKNI
jgi:UDP-3-O-[3-hydroxymyristoyl] glucosamine N-acyltransferase